MKFLRGMLSVRLHLALAAGAALLAGKSSASAQEFRTFDGSSNNLIQTLWGSAGIQYLRMGPASYGDGISTPAGASRPSARAISNGLAASPVDGITNNRHMADFIYAWGQFLDHDLDLTLTATPSESFNIPVPTGDPFFDPDSTGTQVIPLTRSSYDPSTGTSTANPRQQTNQITAWIDASMVYGSSSATAASLRTFSGGKLASSAGNLLPLDSGGPFFLAGDIRANENIELIAMQTLFMREHNRLAENIAASSPGMSDEQIFQAARRIVGAEIQAVTYNEFLPALLGPSALPAYGGYNASLNGSIANEFATAAYRLGHSLLADDVEFLDNNGNTLFPEIPLAQAFFNPGIVQTTGIDPILKYLATSNSQELDTRLVDGVRNFLFGPPGAGGLDLASLNIQRGRDHGLADYNATRVAYGLTPILTLDDITSDTELQAMLLALYGSVNNIDLWVGGLAEDHLPGSSLGELFTAILLDQFTRLREGDRFFYLNDPDLAAALLAAGWSLGDLSLARIIEANTSLTNLQSNVFFFTETSAVPEPGAGLLLLGTLAILPIRRRKHRL